MNKIINASRIRWFLALPLLIVFLLSIQTNEASESSPVDLISTNSQIDEKILQLRPPPNPDKNVYFGDLHVHTANSFDAYTFGTISSPADAYRYAQGQAIPHPTGYQIQLSRPLDFYAVTDHAVFLGLLKEAADTTSQFSRYEIAKPLHDLNASVSNRFYSIMKRSNLFRPFAKAVSDGVEQGTIDPSLIEDVGRTVWQETIEAADDAYVPGSFTAFAGYEYTSSIDLYEKYLHRNVIFRDTKNLPPRLFSRVDSQDPEKLWDWMDRLRSNGVESLAIPHNSNISGGAAFSLNDYNGGPIDEEYANKRALNEPLTEITQVKGTSETHPLLSKNDEWAAFEAKTGHEGEELISNLKGSYVRDAYLRGLTLAEQGTTNPYKFGLIGSSDSHVSGGSDNEEKYFSKVGVLDGTAELRGSIPFNPFYGTILKLVRPNMIKKVDGKDYMAASSRIIHWSASGLAGVWAEENTRESIYDAFRRKETFGTSGPRIKVRFFAGYGLANAQLNSPNLVSEFYKRATSMGGTLKAEGEEEPVFLVWAISDALGAPLQRTQIIKGWLEDGEHQEKVYDVSCSDGLKVNSQTHRCPDNRARVNLNDCSYDKDAGASELKSLWQDPDFKAGQEAFYYARVLENPVCRWSTWDAIRNGEKPRSDLPSTIQERAWSSPIWYTKGS